MGVSEGNDGGDISKGVKARGGWPGVSGAHLGRAPSRGACRLKLWTIHRLGVREGARDPVG